jgi:putative permease
VRQVVRYTVVILLTLSALVILWEFREALLLFVISLVLGAVFRPGVERLVKRGWHRGPAILVVYFLSLVSLIGLIILASGPVAREAQQATDNFAVAYTNLKMQWRDGDGFQQAIAEQLPPLDDLYSAIAAEEGAFFFRSFIGIAVSLFGALSAIAIVLALSMYWSADRVYFERLWLSLVPAGRRTRARDIWREIEDRVGAYVRSEIIQAILAAVLLFVIYSILQLRYPTLLAILGGFAWLIPWVGAVLAIVPAFLVGLQSGLNTAILAAILTMGVLLFMEIVVEKRFFERRHYSSVLLLVVIIALADAFGLVGILIAPPLAAAIQILMSRLLVKPSVEPQAAPEEQLEKLGNKLEGVKAQVGADGPPPPRISNLLVRLEKLIEQSKEAL